MTKTKKIFWNLLIIAQVLFWGKALLSFAITVPYILPDEACIIIRAQHFFQHFQVSSCSDITQLPVNSALPLYSILISPLTYFFSGSALIKAILIFNAALVSSLVWPLFYLFKKFTYSDKKSYISTVCILLLAEFLIYEKTVMTETLFAVINIWLIYFYANSFNKKNKDKLKYKVLTIIFAFASALTRPYGFISILALIINEFYLSKKKKYFLIFLPISLIISIALIFKFTPDAIPALQTKIQTLFRTPQYSLALIKALANQVNSFTVATLLVPIVYFANYINDKSPQFLPKIKFYLISFIILNYLISAQHLFGYFTNKNFDPGMITRYIHTSIILIFIFGLGFFLKHKQLKLNKFGIFSIVVSILSLFFLNKDLAKHTLNLDLAYLLHTGENLFSDLSAFKDIFKYGVLPTLFILLVLAIMNKNKALSVILSAILIIQSSLSVIWASNYAIVSTEVNLSPKENANITYLIHPKNLSHIATIWQMKILTDHNVEISFISGTNALREEKVEITDEMLEAWPNLGNADYIYSPYRLNMPMKYKLKDLYIYKNDKKIINE